MPYKKYPKKPNHYIRKPTQKHYKKTYKPNMGALMDSKVNTLLERKMVAIAKREARINNPSLCLRRYCWLNYDSVTNEFGTLAAGYNTFDWDGKLVNLTQKIIKEDIATIPLASQPAVVDDPNTEFDEAADRAGDGPNILTNRKPDDGRRSGSTIYIRSFSLLHRLKSVLYDADNLYDKIDVHIGLVKIRRIYNEDGSVYQYRPEQLLIIRPFGYNANLDRVDEDDMHRFNPNVLFRDKVVLTSATESHPNVVFKSYKGSFPTPIKIMYDDDDINAITQTYDIYLVVRSTVASTGDAADVAAKPYCQTCAKLYYTNNK